MIFRGRNVVKIFMASSEADGIAKISLSVELREGYFVLLYSFEDSEGINTPS